MWLEGPGQCKVEGFRREVSEPAGLRQGVICMFLVQQEPLPVQAKVPLAALIQPQLFSTPPCPYVKACPPPPQGQLPLTLHGRCVAGAAWVCVEASGGIGRSLAFRAAGPRWHH